MKTRIADNYIRYFVDELARINYNDKLRSDALQLVIGKIKQGRYGKIFSSYEKIQWRNDFIRKIEKMNLILRLKREEIFKSKMLNNLFRIWNFEHLVLILT